MRGSAGARAPIHVHTVIDHLAAGGAELLLGHLAAVAASADVELSVSTLRALPGNHHARLRLQARGIEPSTVPVSSVWKPQDLWRLRSHLARIRPDLVHTHLDTAAVLGNVAASSLGIPSVSTIHADALPLGRRNRARSWADTTAKRYLATQVIAVSDAACNAYR